MKLWNRIAGTSLLCLLAGCAVNAPPEKTEVLPKSLTNEISSQNSWQSTAFLGAVENGWLNSFDDKMLNELVSEVLRANPNLNIAAEQVNIAAGLAKQAGAGLKPSIGLSGTGSNIDASGLASSIESSNAFLGASWELDVWGRLRARSASAEALVAASEADYIAARHSLVAATAKSWFLTTQIQIQEQLALDARNIHTKLVSIVEKRASIGRSAPQDVALAKARLAGINANLLQIQAAKQEILRTMEVLLGRYPSAQLVPSPSYQAQLSPVPAGIPADVLERRPDIAASEKRLAAAFYGAEEARAARLPSLTLTGAGGVTNSGLIDILGLANPIGTIGLDIFAPLYTGGALEAGVEIADAKKRAQMAMYTNTVLQALREVETTLSSEQLFSQREAYINEQARQSTEAYRVMQAQYNVGRIDLQSLLQAQASLLSVKSQQAAVHNERLALRVDLHMALGGSFEDTDKSGGPQ